VYAQATAASRSFAGRLRGKAPQRSSSKRPGATAKPGDRRSFAAVRFIFVARSNLQLPRERERRQMKTPVLQKLFLLCCPRLYSASSSLAQSDIPDAHLLGTLLDASGAGVGRVRVTAQLEGVSDARVWAATSSADGAYALTFPAGRYHVQFVRSPFVFAAISCWTSTLISGEPSILKLQLERLAASVRCYRSSRANPRAGDYCAGHRNYAR